MARRIRSTEQNGNVLITSARGILKFEDTSSVYIPAGVPWPLDFDLSLVSNANGIAFSIGDGYAYRVTLGIFDKHNNFIESAPSQRQVIRAATAGTYAIQINGRLPDFLTTNHFYRIFRTIKVSGGADPGDREYLVYQNFLTISNLGTKTYSVTDITSDEARGEELYTNSSQEGLAEANYQPPYARDVFAFKGYVIAVQTKNKQDLYLKLIGTVSLVGGTITIGGVTYTAAATADTDITKFNPTGENISTGTFVVYTGISSPATRIEGTVRSLVRVINGYPGNTEYYARYDSNPDVFPGLFLLEERAIGGNAFSVTASSSAGPNFDPVIPTTGTSVSSTNNDTPNGIAISKKNEGEHFPLTNYKTVGERIDVLNRGLALRDTAIFIKQQSIWRMTGNSLDSFDISLLSNNISVGESYDSAAIAQNEVYVLSNCGIKAINDAGIRNVGDQEKFNMVIGTFGRSDPFPIGIGFDAFSLYILCTRDPELFQLSLDYPDSYQYPNVCFVYQTDTQSWHRWLMNANCFAVCNDKLYWGLNNDNGSVLRQRDLIYANGTYLFDEQALINVFIINTDGTIRADYIPSVDYGGYFRQFGHTEGFGYGWIVIDGTKRFVVTDYDLISGKTSLTRTDGTLANDISLGAHVCYRPIPWSVEWFFSGNPSTIKSFTDVKFIGSFQNTYEFKIQYANNYDYKKYKHFYSYDSSPPVHVRQNNDLLPWGSPRVTPDESYVDWVDPSRQGGTVLSVKLMNEVADSNVSIKGVAIMAEDTGTIWDKR